MRPTLDEYFLKIAGLVATRATCIRRKVGCVLVNELGHVLATGYNGRPSGWVHCDRMAVDAGICAPEDIYPHACRGAFEPSGQGLDACEAIHAEQNALLQCHDVYSIKTCYTTVAPCVTCLKLLLNTSCTRIVTISSYVHDEIARELWLKPGNGATPRDWVIQTKTG